MTLPTTQTKSSAPLKRFWKKLSKLWKKEINVYLISGMCYNCSVFDKLTLPEGYRKIYIEWLIPWHDETMESYATRMAEQIDKAKPFILIGYSFGGVLVQEMNSFLNPLKTILISSFKGGEETPMSFRAIRKSNMVERIPERLYASTVFITNTFNQLIYHMPTADLSQYMTVVDPVYIKWAVKHITEWKPSLHIKNLYHIHGTLDQIFPYELLQAAFPIEGGDHLMILKKADIVSNVLSSILLIREK